MKKRLFVAVEIPESVKKKIIDLQSDLKSQDIEAKWVHPQNIHLTLVFLGEVTETEISKIANLLEASKIPKFEVDCGNLSGFPNLKRPHTLWVGIENSKRLKELQRRIAKNFKKAGFSLEEREFSPHLTIARFGRKKDLGKINLKKYLDLKLGTIAIKEIILFESELKEEGPRHKIIKRTKLS